MREGESEYEPTEKTCGQCGGAGKVKDKNGNEIECDVCDGNGSLVS